MAAQITIIPGGRSFVCEGEESVLAAGLRAGLRLPHNCRSGDFGACKAKVVSGELQRGIEAEHALSAADRSAGYALLCVAQPLSDLVLEVPERAADLDRPVKKLPARIEGLERLSEEVMRVTLRLPAAERFDFLPGQFIDLILRDGQRRSYSLAHAPHEQDALELHVRHHPGGAFSEWLFKEAKGREILRLEGPYGNFGLRPGSSKPALLLAGSTGFAPLKSIVAHAFHTKDPRPLHLYWGARREEGLYLRDLPKRWAETEAARFQFTPVLSEAGDAAWQGRRGLVHEALRADYPELAGFEVYACGGPAMIAAARAAFLDRGLAPENFLADAFTATAR